MLLCLTYDTYLLIWVHEFKDIHTSSSSGELKDLARLAVPIQVVAGHPSHVDASRSQVLNHEGSGEHVLSVGNRVGLDLFLVPGVILESLVLDLEPGDRGQASGVPFQGEAVVLGSLGVRVDGGGLSFA